MATESNILILTSNLEKDNPILQWTSIFSESLSTSIAQLGVNLPEISAIPFSFPDVIKALKKAKVVIVVLDKLVLNDKIQKETFANFVSKLDETLTVSIVIPEHIELSDVPESLQKKLVYTFYDIDPETELDRKYDAFGNNDESKLFWAKVLDIAFEIKSFLVPNTINTLHKKAVYLAATRPEQYEHRDAIRSELIQRGYTVYPEHLLNVYSKNISDEISALLAKSFLSIHIIGSKYGETIPEIEVSLVELQSKLSAKHLRLSTEKDPQNTFQRLVWIQPGIKPNDEKQRRFISSLRVEEKNSNTEVLQTPLEELKAVLREKLSYLDESEMKISVGSDESVYLIHEPKDNESVSEIAHFFEKQKIRPLTIDFVKMTDNIVASHYTFLTESSSVIICDFACNRQWINSKLKDLIKAPGFGRAKPFNVKAIYTKDITRFSGTDNLLLDGTLDLASALSPFVQKLNHN